MHHLERLPGGGQPRRRDHVLRWDLAARWTRGGGGARAARIAAAAEHARSAPQAYVDLAVLLADEDDGVAGPEVLVADEVAPTGGEQVAAPW